MRCRVGSRRRGLGHEAGLAVDLAVQSALDLAVDLAVQPASDLHHGRGRSEGVWDHGRPVVSHASARSIRRGAEAAAGRRQAVDSSLAYVFLVLGFAAMALTVVGLLAVVVTVLVRGGAGGRVIARRRRPPPVSSEEAPPPVPGAGEGAG